MPVDTPFVPGSAPEWSGLLEQLAAQLADPQSELARRHYDHPLLYQRLLAALAALGQATPEA